MRVNQKKETAMPTIPPIPASHLRIRRAYVPPTAEDGARILIDRLWPRGVKKEALALHSWQRELAPSTALRQWFGHDPAKWEAFRQRYRAELAQQETALAALWALARAEVVTLVYAAHDEAHNNAVVVREVLLER